MKKILLIAIIILLCGNISFSEDLKINTYGGRSEIPEDANPNEETLKYYLKRYLTRNWNTHRTYSNIKASDNPYQFQFDLREDKYIKKQMQKTALLSYLLYEDGKIVIDEITPKEKYGDLFSNSTLYQSQSVGKSIASYILGHAICKGYIESIETKISDWPVLKDTLYQDQKIIDLINMSAGDQEYLTSNRFLNSNRAVTNPTIKSAMKNELKNSIISKRIWNYNNLLPHIILNYVIFKVGEDKFQNLLEEIFRDKAKTEFDSHFVETEISNQFDRSISNTLMATRYDYLRIAKIMLDDWQKGNCEGNFLKSLSKFKVKKNRDYSDKQEAFTITKSYGGFFHLDPSGINNRNIFIMDGYGGQTITIDFDRERIVATMAIHRDFNWKKIAYSVIKKGK
jgi:hypothetical protein